MAAVVSNRRVALLGQSNQRQELRSPGELRRNTSKQQEGTDTKLKTTGALLPKIPSYESVQDIDYVEHIQHNEVLALSNVVGGILQKLCTKSIYAKFRISPSNPLYTVFSKTNLPKITLQDYCIRIMKFAKVSVATVVQSVIYIDKVITQHPKLLTSKSVHRLLLASIVVAAKFTDDFHLTNKNFARVGGVQIKEMNSLEINFCKLMSFSLFTPSHVFIKYWKTIHSLAQNVGDNEDDA